MRLFAGFILLTSQALPEDHCLANYFHGRYGGNDLYLPTADCASSSSSLTAGSPIIRAPIQQLVWLEHKSVEESLKEGMDEKLEFDSFLARLAGSTGSQKDQRVFETVGYSVLQSSDTSALLSVNAEQAEIIDTILPRFWKSTLIPSAPIPTYIPVPSKSVLFVKSLLESLKFNPDVSSIVNNISVSQMYDDIRWLTGEDGKSGIVSRHSFAEGSRTAAAWLKERFEETGAECNLKHFRFGFAPNVVCRYNGTDDTTGTVLFSAHYDSRGSFGSTRAPGGDDDGSGTTSLLSIARAIKRKGVTFHQNVELVAFAGEEQGLVGSRAYSRELREANANLTIMIQADMLAYHAAGEPAQLGLPLTIGTAEVTQLVANISAIYSPELKVGFTSACCSDHQSFHEQGFASTQVFERAGPIADPMYHNSGDLSDRPNYDMEQVKSIAKVQFATLLHAAGFDLPGSKEY